MGPLETKTLNFENATEIAAFRKAMHDCMEHCDKFTIKPYECVLEQVDVAEKNGHDRIGLFGGFLSVTQFAIRKSTDPALDRVRAQLTLTRKEYRQWLAEHQTA